MPVLEVIGVPFDGYARDGRQSAAARVLRESGLLAALSPHEVVDGGDLDLPSPDAARGRATSLINEAALVGQSSQVAERVADAVGAGRFPVLVGGDCTTLLGTMTGLRRLDDRPGLLFIDGHEDTMPLDVSEDGEAANTEIGLLLGLTGGLLTGPLTEYRARLDRDRLAVLGPRDRDWRRRFNVGTLREAGVWLRDVDEVAAAPAVAAAEAVDHLRERAGRWWLHVDLDVLDPQVFPAQGLPEVPDEPGGLDLAALSEVMVTAAGRPGIVGLSVAIYDPDQDPDRSGAAQAVSLVADVARALT